MAIHFNTAKERLDFLKGKHEEYVPVEYKPVEVEEEKPKAKPKAEPKKESKPKKKSESKGKKK